MRENSPSRIPSAPSSHSEKPTHEQCIAARRSTTRRCALELGLPADTPERDVIEIQKRMRALSEQHNLAKHLGMDPDTSMEDLVEEFFRRNPQQAAALGIQVD